MIGSTYDSVPEYGTFENLDDFDALRNNSVQTGIGDVHTTRWNGRAIRARNLTLFSISAAAVFGSEIVNQFYHNNGKLPPSASRVITATNYSFLGVIIAKSISSSISDENKRKLHSFLARWSYELLLQIPTQVQLNFAREGVAKYGFDAFFYMLTTSNLTRDVEVITGLKHRDRAPYASFKGEKIPMWGLPTANSKKLALIEGIFLTASIAVMILQSQFPQMNVDKLNLPMELAAFVMGSSFGKIGMHGLIKLSDHLIEKLNSKTPFFQKPKGLSYLHRFFTYSELIEPLAFSILFAIPHPLGIGGAGTLFGADLFYRQTRAELREFRQWKEEYGSQAEDTSLKVEWAVTGLFTAWMFAWYIGYPLHDTLVGENPTSIASWINLACFLASYLFSFAGGRALSLRQERNRDNGFLNLLEFCLFDSSLLSLSFLYGFRTLNMDDDGVDDDFKNDKILYTFVVLAWISFGATFGLNRAAGFRPERYTSRAMNPPVGARILGGHTMRPFIEGIKKLSSAL